MDRELASTVLALILSPLIIVSGKHRQHRPHDTHEYTHTGDVYNGW